MLIKIPIKKGLSNKDQTLTKTTHIPGGENHTEDYPTPFIDKLSVVLDVFKIYDDMAPPEKIHPAELHSNVWTLLNDNPDFPPSQKGKWGGYKLDTRKNLPCFAVF
jgi:hypothetical protein